LFGERAHLKFDPGAESLASEESKDICHYRAPRTESELFLLVQRTNVRHQSVNLILVERILERGHSALAIGNDFSELRIRQFLNYRGAEVRNIHALSNLRAASIWTMAYRTFRTKRRATGRTVWTGLCFHNRDNKERKANEKHKQN
jgi:hypothetical protein